MLIDESVRPAVIEQVVSLLDQTREAVDPLVKDVYERENGQQETGVSFEEMMDVVAPAGGSWRTALEEGERPLVDDVLSSLVEVAMPRNDGVSIKWTPTAMKLWSIVQGSAPPVDD
jgi:hypothetical protein